MDRGAWGLQSIGLQRVGNDWATWHPYIYIYEFLCCTLESNMILWLNSQFSCSVMSDTMWLYGQASLSITNSWNLLKLMSIESMMPFNHLVFCCPLLLLQNKEYAMRLIWGWSALGSNTVLGIIETQLGRAFWSSLIIFKWILQLHSKHF